METAVPGRRLPRNILGNLPTGVHTRVFGRAYAVLEFPSSDHLGNSSGLITCGQAIRRITLLSGFTVNSQWKSMFKIKGDHERRNLWRPT